MFIQYNPNPLNKHVSDCTVRAICKLLDKDWDTVYGVPQPLRKFKFEEVIESPNEALPDAKEVPNFVTKEEFNSAIDKLSSLIEDAMNQKVYFSKNRGEKRESNIRSDK